MSARLTTRFSGDGSEILLLTNIGDVVNRMSSIINEYYNADISTLRELQKTEFSINAIYREGWDRATKEYISKKKNPHLRAVHQSQFPPEYHIALICYTLEFPAVYEEFNRKTRNVKQKSDLDNYHYKSYFIFLLKSIREMTGSPSVQPGVLYRGCSVQFGNAKPGILIIFQQFTSTSSDINIADMFRQGGGTLFEIHGYIENSTGLNHHSVSPHENEFVIWPFEAFLVKQVTKQGNLTKIVLQA